MKSHIIGATTSAASTSVVNYNSVTSGGTGSYSTTEATRAQVVPHAMTIDQLRVSTTVAPGAAASGKKFNFTLMVNGVASTLTTDVLETATASQDLTHTVSLSAGDVISIRTTPTGTPSAPGVTYWTMRMDASSAFAVMGQNIGSPTSGTNYQPAYSRALIASTNVLANQIVPTSGTLSNLYVWYRTAPAGTASMAVTLMVNGVASTLTTTISGSTVLSFDTTHSVSISAGDLIALQLVATNTPTSTTVGFAMTFSPTTDGESFVMNNDNGNAASTSATQYNNLVGPDTTWNATESNRLTRLPATTVKAMYVETSVSPGVSPKAYAVTLRQNTADTTATVTINDASTTVGSTRRGQTTGLSVAVADDDNMAIKSAPSGSPGSVFIKSSILTFISSGITTTQTQTGVARITALTTKTQTGVARITATTTKTQTGVANIAAASTTTQKTQTGTARITAVTVKTITGLARITAKALKTVTGLARITATTVKTITGVSRITSVVSKTQTGVARVTAKTTRTQTGLARITNVTTRTQTGLGRVQLSKTVTISGLSRITAQTARMQVGISRITASTPKTQLGKARITVTTLKTILGLSRITSVVQKTITGISRITASTQKTQTGKANIRNTTLRTQTGVANIVNTTTTTKTQTGLARITAKATKTQIGIARITAVVTRTQTGKANIVSLTLQTITGKSRITATNTKNIVGLSRITAKTTKTQLGIARIVAQVLKTITGKARLSGLVLRTITGKSAIIATVLRVITGKANIGVTTKKTITGTARIVHGIDISPPRPPEIRPANNFLRYIDSEKPRIGIN